MSPSAFERLIQRILREKGFSQVEVTGKTGDGGIDGKGIARINGILRFHIIFQCKRYKGKVRLSGFSAHKSLLNFVYYGQAKKAKTPQV
jgi:restriction system protein